MTTLIIHIINDIAETETTTMIDFGSHRGVENNDRRDTMAMAMTMIIIGDEAEVIVEPEGTDKDRDHAVRPRMAPRDPIIQDQGVGHLHDETIETMIEIPCLLPFAHAHLTRFRLR